MKKNKQDLLKKIFNVADMQPIYDKVLDDWAATQIDLKTGGLTLDEKIEVLNEKIKPKDIVVGSIKKSKKLK